MITRPDRSESAEYYYRYIDLVPDGDVVGFLERQQAEWVGLLGRITDTQSLYRRAPGAWSIRDVCTHVNDAERLFVFRAFWFARGLDVALPGYDQDVAARAALADERSWAGIRAEFEAVRGSTLALFASLPADAWSRGGVASGSACTVRALAYMTAGHVEHHAAALRETLRLLGA